MSLTGRFSAFFLAALALVLVGFSTVLYLSARFYFDRELDNRMAAALAVLAAAAEIHPEGVEWEPSERFLRLGQEPGLERVRWMVLDPHGRTVDRSRNLEPSDLTDRWTPRPGTAKLPPRLLDRHGRAWRVSQRLIGPDTPAADQAARPGMTDPEGAPAQMHPSLTFTVFALPGPVEATLTWLAWSLVGLSVGFWLLSALLCRRLSRRALAPLTRLVESARGLDAADAGWSLPQAGTGDELAELGAAFNDLLSRLRIAYERQRRFSGDASHQLRTPLTVLIGQLEVALRQERPADEYRRVLGTALRRSTQLGQIVEALLFLARAEGDALLPEVQVIDLACWAAIQVDDRRVAHPELMIVEDHLRKPDPIFVRVHPPLLGQLLENLLDNARKYGPPDQAVRVETRVEGEFAILAVVDRGPGIPAADLPHVFEPFYRSSQARRRGIVGVGLGLSVGRRIAQAFGGELSLLSEPGQGCRVEVRLPLFEPARTDEASQGATNRIDVARDP